MYGSQNPYANANNAIRNEIAFQNLIAVANTPVLFNALSEEQMAKIDEYLKALQPTQSPYLDRDGTLSESAQRGKDIFESVGCATCHPAPLYTDLKMHASKATSDNTNWEYREMDTSSLVEVWRTGAWVFDGRFGTMEETVRYYADGKGLTDAQITDLTNYVMSIGDEGEYYGVEQILVTASSGNIINAITPGGKVTQMTVRRQLTDAPTTVNVTVTLASGGKTLKTVTKQLTNVEYNTAKLINFDTPISIPSDLTSGSTLTVSFAATDGTTLASDLVIKY